MAYGKIKADTLVYDNSGSDVDLVVSDIVTAAGVTFTGNVSFDGQAIVKGDSTNGSGELTLNCENNSHGIKIKGPPHSAGATYTLTLPNNTGTNGQVLTTNGSGVSSWSTIDLSSKLSLAGGQMTGNITFSGSQTVDGRNLSVDGTKLDGIETAATADQTAAEILTAIKTVDGASSGLDADLLDGQHGAYYTGYVDTAIANLIDSAPATLDTLNELAAALGDDPNFATTVTNSIATKLPLAGGTLTGNLSVNRTSGSNDVFNGKLNGTATSTINADGSVSFAGSGDFGSDVFVDQIRSKTLSNSASNGTYFKNRNAAGGGVTAVGIVETGLKVGDFSSSLSATETIKLNTSGSATFAGTIFSGAIVDNGATSREGSLMGAGSVFIQKTTGNNSSALNVYQGANTTPTFSVRGDGAITSAGSITVTGTGQYTGAQRGVVSTHNTASGNFTMNLNTANNWKLTLVGNTTILSPANQTAGQHGVVSLIQDGTGGRTAAFEAHWKFPGGTAPTLSTAANSRDLLAYYVQEYGIVYAQLITDLK